MPKAKKDISIRLLNEKQQAAWEAIEDNFITFLIGPAGTAKSFLSTAYAAHSILTKSHQKIILTRPVVEAGERLGYLPGEFSDKIKPYLMPIMDAAEKILGKENAERMSIEEATEIAPLAYIRGRTFTRSICLLDEAQNVTASQMRMYLSRLGQGSKMIVNGDPDQSDIGRSPLNEMVDRLEGLRGVAVVRFNRSDIVRHPIIADVLDAIEHVT